MSTLDAAEEISFGVEAGAHGDDSSKMPAKQKSSS
jgi:hypothetical protein